MKRNSFTFALVLSTLCFALIGNGCSDSSGGILGPEQIAASDIPAGDDQKPFRNPEAPSKLSASWNSMGAELDWSCDCEAVTFFRVYRQIDGGAATMVHATSYSEASDILRNVDYQKVVYYVTGVDAYGNESDASNRVASKKSDPKLPNAEDIDTDTQQQ